MKVGAAFVLSAATSPPDASVTLKNAPASTVIKRFIVALLFRSSHNRRRVQPRFEWHNEDGSLTWEFSRQPEGTECFMATIGPDQILRSIEQVLTEANFERIQPGMIHQEVLRRLGKPARKEYFELKQEHVWSWLIDRRMPSQKVYFTVSFNADGRVTHSGPFTEQTH